MRVVDSSDLQGGQVEALAEHVDADDDPRAPGSKPLQRGLAITRSEPAVQQDRPEVAGHLGVHFPKLLSPADGRDPRHQHMVLVVGQVRPQPLHREVGQGTVLVDEIDDRPILDRSEVPLILREPQWEPVDLTTRQAAPILAERGRGELEDGLALEGVANLSPRPGLDVVGLVDEQVGTSGEQGLADLGRLRRKQRVRRRDEDVAGRGERPCGFGTREPVVHLPDNRPQRLAGDNSAALEDAEPL